MNSKIDLVVGTAEFPSKTQKPSHTSRFEPEIKDERSSAKNVGPERLRCETIHKEMS